MLSLLTKQARALTRPSELYDKHLNNGPLVIELPLNLDLDFRKKHGKTRKTKLFPTGPIVTTRSEMERTSDANSCKHLAESVAEQLTIIVFVFSLICNASLHLKF